MSWNINLVGHRAAVKAKVLAEPYVPTGVKQAIVETIDDIATHSPKWIRVTSYGHHGGGSSTIGKLEVESIAIVLDEPAPSDAKPEDPATSTKA